MWDLDHKEGWTPKELMLSNCGVREDSWESLGLQRDQASQSILNINPNYSLKGLILKLKPQCFGHLMQRANSLEKTLMLGKIEGSRRKRQQRVRWLDGITKQWTWIWASSRKWWRTGKPGVLQLTGCQKIQTRLSDWTTFKVINGLNSLNVINSYN